jgi:hypothetical protein
MTLIRRLNRIPSVARLRLRGKTVKTHREGRNKPSPPLCRRTGPAQAFRGFGYQNDQP